MGDLFDFYTIVALVLGYLLGSISFGLVLTRAAGLGDVRNIGSGNIGATNVLRTGNKGLAALTLILDLLKGTAAVLLGYAVGSLGDVAIPASLVAGFGAFIGHTFPVWLSFKGGKGVATYLGVLLGLHSLSALAFCTVWLLTAILWRYSSLSAIIASIVTPIWLLTAGDYATATLAALLSGLLIYKHRANIHRLVAGEEPRIGTHA